MILIAHRGNINGPNPKRENRTDYLFEALNAKYQIEIDLWYEDKQWWSGHDEPRWKIGMTIFNCAWAWLHAKNKEALEKLQSTELNYFWHDGDDYTITSKGYIWCHKDAELVSNGICLLPENGYKGDITKCHGICSDYMKNWKAL